MKVTTFMYLIEMSTNIGKIEKWLPPDRLVKNKEPLISIIQLKNEHGRDLNEYDINEPGRDLNETEFYSSNSEEEHALCETTIPQFHLQSCQVQPNYHINLS